MITIGEGNTSNFLLWDNPYFKTLPLEDQCKFKPGENKGYMLDKLKADEKWVKEIIERLEKLDYDTKVKYIMEAYDTLTFLRLN